MKPTQQLYERLTRDLAQVVAADQAAAPSRSPVGRYRAVVQELFVRECVLLLKAPTADVENRLSLMAAAVWLAYLTEPMSLTKAPPLSAVTLPTPAKLAAICSLLETQSRGFTAETPVQRVLAEGILAGLTRVTYEEDGAPSLLAFFEGPMSGGWTHLNCVDLVLYAHLRYSWLGIPTFVCADGRHAWLQTKEPAVGAADAYDVAYAWLGATQFYDVAEPTRWLPFSEWVRVGGHSNDGRGAAHFDSAALFCYFLFRSAIAAYGVGASVRGYDRADMYRIARLYANVVETIVARATAQHVPAHRLAYIEAHYATCLAYGFLIEKDSGFAPPDLRPGTVPGTEQWPAKAAAAMRRCMAIRQGQPSVPMFQMAYFCARGALDGNAAVEMSILVDMHEAYGGVEGFVSMARALKQVAPAALFADMDPYERAALLLRMTQVWTRNMVVQTRIESTFAFKKWHDAVAPLVLVTHIAGQILRTVNAVRRVLFKFYDMDTDTGTLTCREALPPGPDVLAQAIEDDASDDDNDATQDEKEKEPASKRARFKAAMH